MQVGADAVSANNEGKMQGNALLRAVGLQQAQMDHLRAETASNNARAMMYQSRTPSDEALKATRDALVSAGNDPDDVDAALNASRLGDHSGLRALMAPPSKDRILRTPSGYVRAPNGGGSAQPVVGVDGKPVMPIIAPPRSSSRAPAPNAGTRQALGAVTGQLRDDRQQIAAMDRGAPPLIQGAGIVTGTPADSVEASRFHARRARVEQHADSLAGVRDSLAGEMTHPSPQGGMLKPLTPAQKARAQSNPDYRQFLSEKGYKF